MPYEDEPFEGQANADLFKRTLRYNGSEELDGKLKRGMPYYELAEIETVGTANNGNMVIRGECISACAYLKDQGIEVDLVYIDPPFASGADYAKKVYLRRNPHFMRQRGNTEEKLHEEEIRFFEEKMYGDVWDKAKYLNWMYENLTAIRSVMSERASIYVHLDYRIGHYVKIMLDDIFGEARFRNEIVWCYKSGGAGKKQFAKKHDVIYFYSKHADYVFNPQQEKSYMKAGSGKNPAQTYYTDEHGSYTLVQMKDYWTDIGMLATSSEERVNYVTQKPEALLERIIQTSTNEGMLVADFFGGSGVAAAVAHRLGRRFIHCDVGWNSIQTVRDRLVAQRAPFHVYDIRDGVELFRNPVQTMDKLKTIIPGWRSGDSRLERFWTGFIDDNTWGIVPVYIPNLLDGSAKWLDAPFIRQVLTEAIPKLDRSIRKVIVYYVDADDMQAIRKIIAAHREFGIEIELRDFKSLLENIAAGDEVDFSLKETSDERGKSFTITIDAFLSDRVSEKLAAWNQKAQVSSSKRGKTYEAIRISENGLELIEFVSVDCTARDGAWHSEHEIKIDKHGYITVDGTKTKRYWDGKITSERLPLRLKVRNICGDETIFSVNKVDQ